MLDGLGRKVGGIGLERLVLDGLGRKVGRIGLERLVRGIGRKVGGIGLEAARGSTGGGGLELGGGSGTGSPRRSARFAARSARARARSSGVRSRSVVSAAPEQRAHACASQPALEQDGRRAGVLGGARAGTRAASVVVKRSS